MAADLRNDGRSRLDWRFFRLSTAVIPHAAGSARIQLANTEAIVAVTLDIVPTAHSAPHEGIVKCSVEFSPTCGSASPFSTPARALLLSRQLESLYVDSASIDRRQLCIIPGSQCWNLRIDALVLLTDGNVLDAVTLAAKAALLTTAVPALTIAPAAAGAAQPEISLSDEPPTALRLTRSMPVSCTLTCLSPLSPPIIDASEEEESAAACSLSLGVTEDGGVLWLWKGGAGLLGGGTAGAAGRRLGELRRLGRKVGRDMNRRVREMVEDGRSQADKDSEMH